MDISLSKLPWYGQLGAFVLVCGGAVYGFWSYYVSDFQTELVQRQQHLAAIRVDVNKGIATARRLPEFQSQVGDLERRLEGLKNVLPEQKDVADTLRRMQGLATESNLVILRFTPAAQKQQALYQEVPYRISAEGTYHNLGVFFDRVSKFPRIINISDIAIHARSQPDANATVTAECTATTFVLAEGGRGGGPGAGPAAR
ncbi:MAG TPA: type 4a pilus biogenesis protein PilO [Vicinamibacterales bacterium]|jgi:type IV pilus assembly protein PilO|nr:type 4a pilus biogenesis protein PilO [Vicinamibacterales bacterium]